MTLGKPKRVVSVSVLPGEPLDGSGKVCIHLFVPDESGPFVEPHVLRPEIDERGNMTGRIVAKPTRGMLACNRKLLVKPVTVRGVTKITHRTDDPRAVTCPACKLTQPYLKMMENLGNR